MPVREEHVWGNHHAGRVADLASGGVTSWTDSGDVLPNQGPTSGRRSSAARVAEDDKLYGDRVRVDDVPFDCDVTMAEAVHRVIAMAPASDRPRYVCTGNWITLLS